MRRGQRNCQALENVKEFRSYSDLNSLPLVGTKLQNHI